MSTKPRREKRLAALEKEVATIEKVAERRAFRKRSRQKLWGVPIYDIAIGADLSKGESRGHAHGIIAIGDVATGILSIGWLAAGMVAIGGVAAGLVSLGGCSAGLLASMGGLSVGGLSYGGVSTGVKSDGGTSVDYFE